MDLDKLRVRLLGLAILVVGLLNGVGPFLRRTGCIEPGRYERFWDLHTGPAGFTRSPLGLGRRCVTHRPVEEGGAEAEGGGEPAQYVFAVRRWEVPLKAAKDLVLAAVAVASLAAFLRKRGPLVPLPRSWPAVAIAALVAWHAGAGLVSGATASTAAGLRSFAFLGVAIAAGWATASVLERLVPWLLSLLALQLVLAPVELLRGIPVQGHMALFGEYFARRASGTFVMPNTLGVFAACVVALAAGLGATARVRAVAWGVGAAVVLVSGSGTGFVVLAGVAAVETLSGKGRPGLLALIGGAAALLAGALSLYVTRPDALESVEARVGAYRAALGTTPAEALLGGPLGSGTNADLQRRVVGGNDVPAPAASEGIAGSTVSTLLAQTGLVGLALFAAALGLAWLRSPAARPLVLALSVSSLTLSVTEAFPVNLLLGLALAASLGGARHDGAPARGR